VDSSRARSSAVSITFIPKQQLSGQSEVVHWKRVR